MPVFRIKYEAMGKKYVVIVEEKNESKAVNRVLKMIKNLGMESEAEIYSVKEIE